jgi:exonuclease III
MRMGYCLCIIELFSHLVQREDKDVFSHLPVPLFHMCFRVVSWNVNGIRATLRQTHFCDWFTTFRPEILCLQEVKAEPHQVDLAVVPHLHNYKAYWNSSTSKKGYSGVLTLTSVPPLAHWTGFGNQIFDEVHHSFSSV